MTFKEWFSRRSPLQLALDRGTQPGSDLAAELRELKDYSIKSQADAEAICDVLALIALPGSNIGGPSAFHSLIRLFQDVDGTDCPAFGVMEQKGIELLVQIVNDELNKPTRRDTHDILFALKILAMYGSSEGTDAVICAALQPLQPDAYLWSVILQAYTAGHPQCERLFRELSDPLPRDFLAIALLDSANTAHRNGVNWPHPIDSIAGRKHLETWLTGTDAEHFSYAISTTAALPFISKPDALLALAFDHLSPDVQLEAAWVAAMLGRDAGIRWLARSCLDVNMAERAKQYLLELGRTDAIPPEAENPSFQARAEFAKWLAHPSELGRPPDELEIIDHREMPWPPDRESKPLWLIKYRIKDSTGLAADDVGVGLVGSVTFCLFTYQLEQRPPEDGYAIHCFWEMQCRELIEVIDVESGSTEYDTLVRLCNVVGLNSVRINCVVEPSAELKYPQRLVALGTAIRHGEPGWIVIDGPRSRWYPASEMPDNVLEQTVILVHVGRVILGFHEEPDRHRFLQSAPPPQPPEQIITAYDKLLDKARNEPKEAKNLLAGSSVLSSSFDDYVAALASTRAQPLSDCTATAYEKLQAIAELAEASERDAFFDCFTPLGDAFDKYVEALIALNRQAEVPALVEKFRPYWGHNLGYGKLGSAAFQSGHDELAESFFLKLRHSYADWCRCDEMGFLAEIWKKRGRSEEAQTLLIDALKGLQEEWHTATGSDRKLFEDWFQTRRSTYLKLFPEHGDTELRRQGIVPSPLT